MDSYCFSEPLIFAKKPYKNVLQGLARKIQHSFHGFYQDSCQDILTRIFQDLIKLANSLVLGLLVSGK